MAIPTWVIRGSCPAGLAHSKVKARIVELGGSASPSNPMTGLGKEAGVAVTKPRSALLSKERTLAASFETSAYANDGHGIFVDYLVGATTY